MLFSAIDSKEKAAKEKKYVTLPHDQTSCSKLYQERGPFYFDR